MRFLGIDPSTKTGLAYIDGKEISTTVIQHVGLKGIARVRAIRQSFTSYMHAHNPSIVVIEGYAYANSFTLCTLVEIGCVFRLAMYETGVPCYICPPSVLKKFATGKGVASKSEIAAAVKSRWGLENPSDDVVDAFVLAKIAEALASDDQAVKGLELLN